MMNLYTIKDCKSQSFQGMYPCPNDALAIRSFSSQNVKQQFPTIAEFPGDFQLFKVGEFDDVTGELKADLKHVADFVVLFEVSKDGKQS